MWKNLEIIRPTPEKSGLRKMAFRGPGNQNRSFRKLCRKASLLKNTFGLPNNYAPAQECKQMLIAKGLCALAHKRKHPV
jgi:hypothetical protein